LFRDLEPAVPVRGEGVLDELEELALVLGSEADLTRRGLEIDRADDFSNLPRPLPQLVGPRLAKVARIPGAPGAAPRGLDPELGLPAVKTAGACGRSARSGSRSPPA